MDLNPLDWDGPSFLLLYAVLAAGALLLVSRLRKRLGVPPGQPAPALDPVQTAYLAGGPVRAADTVLVGLVTFGAATYHPGTGHFEPRPGATVPAWLHPYAASVVRQTSREAFHAAIAMPLAQLRTGLEARALVATQDQLMTFRRTAFLVMAVPIGLGLLELLVGLNVGRPVLFLVLALAATAIAARIVASTRHVTTRAGAAALQHAREASTRLRRAPRNEELAMAFAMGGAAVLAGTSLAPFGRTLRNSGDGSSDGGGSDGSSSDSSDCDSSSSDSSSSDSSGSSDGGGSSGE